MKRIAKTLLWVLGGIAFFITALAVVLPFVVDPNDYKKEISDLVRRHTGRQLEIPGDLSLSVFPWLGVETGPISMSNPAGFDDQPMVAVDSAKIRVKLLPLLRKEFQLDTIVLQKPDVRLVVQRDGRSNWQDLAAGPGEQAAGKTAIALAINGLKLEDGEVLWSDQQSGSTYSASRLYVETGRILNQRPVDIKVRTQVTGAGLPKMNIALQATAVLDIERSTIEIQRPHLTLSAAGINTALNAATVRFEQENLLVSADKLASEIAFAGEIFSLDVDKARYSVKSMAVDLDNVNGAGKLVGIDVSTQIDKMSANLGRQTMAVPSFAMRAGDARIAGLLTAKNVLESPRVTGRLQTNDFNARSFVDGLKLAWQPSDANALTSSQIVTDFDAGLDRLVLQRLHAQVDGAEMTGFFSVENYDKPKYQFDLRVSELDLDRYIPKSGTADRQQALGIGTVVALPIAMFKGLNANGVLSIGALKVSGLRTENILVGLRSNDDAVDVEPLNADVYGGRLKGTMHFREESRGASLSVKQEIAGVNVGPLLRAADVTDRIEGKGHLSLNATALERKEGPSIQGSAQFRFNDGAIKGVDLRTLALQAKQIYNQARGREMSAANSEKDEFRFTEMQGSLQFNERSATNQDLRIKSPLLRVLGAGNADLERQTLNYRIEMYIVESARGQGGEDFSQLRGLPIPVKVTGPIARPEYHLDVERLLQLVLQKRLQKEQDKLQQKLEDKLQDKLEKLLQ